MGTVGADPFDLVSEQTLENGLTSKVTYSYNAFATFQYSPYSAVLTRLVGKDEYDFGQTTPAKTTIYTYQTFGATPISPVGPFDSPCKVAVQDIGGNLAAETDYLYDEGTTVCGSPGTPSASTVSSLTGHDETNYGATSTAHRANPTKVTHCLITSGACAAGSPTTTYTYDEAGQALTEADPCGNTTCSDMTGSNHTTTYSYADSYTVLSGGQNVTYTPSGNTNAYPTKITDPLGHTENFTYDFNNAQLTISKDQNAQTTSYLYNDSFARPTKITYPDGGLTTIAYNDSPYNASTPSPSVTTTKAVTSSANLTTLTAFDGVGHTVRSVLTSDPGCSTGDRTDTTYDGLGHVHTVSNPYCTTSDPTYGITTSFYDALGRTCLVVPPDGTLPSGGTCPTTQPTNTIFTTYSGNTTTVTDQTGKSRKSVTDGLGRLTQLFEDPGGVNYETDYSYDALDNLLCVGQKGTNTGSFSNCASIPTSWRPRNFAYNSLSQLTTATNPESGAITYVYDANGNLTSKTAPAPNQTGTATVTTTYQYEPLSRLTQKSFSDGSTPTVKYGYDGVALSGCTVTPPTLTDANPIGRRTSMCDGAGAESWSHDSMGRMLTDSRITNSVFKPTVYAYNFDGSSASLTYPSNRVVNYAYDSAARALSAIDSTGPINYATAASYVPTGALSSLTNGAGLISTLFYNSRLQPCRISVKSSGTAPSSCTDTTTGNVLDFTYNFNFTSADNGNVAGITNNRDNTRSQNFTYDQLNRIASAATQTSGVTIPNSNCWGLTFGYDPWGNLLQQTISGPSGCGEPAPLNVTATTANRISGYCYDSAGNLLDQAACSTGAHAYVYNAENQLTSTAGITYTYDGDGKRAIKSNGKLYWYGMGSDPLDETDSTGSITNTSFNEYVFFNGKRIARRDYLNNVNYYFADHLGTARVNTNSSGTICYDADFYPFGGERIISDSCDSAYKFTGKERDTESGLDNFGARYDSSSLGRFMSPDWSARPSTVPYAEFGDPQSLNLYAYVRNNPLSRTDPSGHYICIGTKEQCKIVADGLAQARAALQGQNLTKKQRTELNKVVSTFGKAGDEHDGVTISFGKTQSAKAAAEAHNYKDEHGLLRTDITFNSKSFGSFSTVEVAGQLVHERSHGIDGIARGNMDPQTKNEEFRTELRAYGMQSYVPKGLGVSYPGLWNPNWPSDSAEASRFTGVLSGAITSTSDWCALSGGPGC